MPYIRSGNVTEVKHLRLENLKLRIANYPDFICTFAGAELWSDCKKCNGKRKDCKAKWGDMDKPIIYVYSLEFCPDKHLQGLLAKD